MRITLELVPLALAISGCAMTPTPGKMDAAQGPVALRGHALAQAFAVLWQVQDVRVAAAVKRLQPRCLVGLRS